MKMMRLCRVSLYALMPSLCVNVAYGADSTKSSVTAEAMQTPPDIDFNKLPIPGEEAFWVSHPDYCPNNEILFIPSQHNLPWRFIRSDIKKAAQEADMLFVESDPNSYSWDDTVNFKKAFHYEIEDLKKADWIRDEPFRVCDRKKPELVGIWSDELRGLSDDIDVQKIEKLFSPILGDIPLKNVHPFLIANVLMKFGDSKKHFFGMDNQLEKYFELNKKPILELETKEQLSKIDYGVKDYIQLKKKPPINLGLLYRILLMTREVSDKDASDYSSYKYFLEQKDFSKKIAATNIRNSSEFDEDVLEVNARNINWYIKLVNFIRINKGKRIAVIVGGMHFIGKYGLFRIFSDDGFTFAPFQSENPVAYAHRSIKTRAATEEEEKIVQAEKKKNERGTLQQKAITAGVHPGQAQ